ncbi:MAG: GTPase Era [Clostridia bacterium]
MFKTGYITIVGKPNAGKSTLVNKLVGFKVAITTPKPQTTRFNIKGIITTDISQMILIDTPGIHLPKHKLGQYMMQGVVNSINNVDVVIYLVDATRPKIDETSKKIIQNVIDSNAKIILCINKIDKIEKSRILLIMNEYNKYINSIKGSFDEIIPISIYKNDGIDILIKNIEKYLPEGEPIYDEDEITDITQRELVEEIIREKCLNNLDEEVPHGIKIEVENFKEVVENDSEISYNIDVNLICEKDSHKPIIIGKDGQMLKKITQESKKEIKAMLESKVELKIWVKVRPNWQEKDIYINNVKSKF